MRVGFRRFSFLVLAAVSVAVFTSVIGCQTVKKTDFSYKGVIVEAFDPERHHPSPEFAERVRREKVYLTDREVKSLKKCIDLLAEKDLIGLLRFTEKWVVVNCPYSFADKLQSVIYLDKEKVQLNLSVADDWNVKLWKTGPEIRDFSGQIAFRSGRSIPNLLRIILHEIGHMVEYKILDFSWRGEFLANNLNREFVAISWDEEQNWKDRENMLQRLHEIETRAELEEFINWFKNDSSFFSVYSGTGMNEDFAESFVYYYLFERFDYSLDLTVDGETIVSNLQKINDGRRRKLQFIAEIMRETGKETL